MPPRVFAQKMKEIDELTILAEQALAQLHLKTEELKTLCRKRQGVLPNPASLIDPSILKQPRK